ncbi:hypothetical protein JET68_15930 [Pseudomonas monteilii]|uniref:phage head spike fiber domain-containing protein n=1 Tax=Pseudomonas TaxID=286 RepID=UPI0018E6C40D|nr:MULTISPECIES: hypothetical protein [Pseudomonas]MBI6920297.1 hypothetical protein [Pseudomonas monteilii]MCE0939662.1 hypothetical protein [Pseudomonas kurunegalensis]
MEAKSFSDLISFSRASVARYFNSAGLMIQAAVNEPRFEFDPGTLDPLGLKMEPQRTNSLTYSQDFSNAAWVKTRTAVSGASAAPDGTNTAQTITLNDATGSNYLYRTGVAWTAGTVYTLSCYAKAGNQSIISLQLNPGGFGSNQQINFDLSGNGSFVVVAGTPIGRIEKLANGWFKCSVTQTATTTTAAANWIVISQPKALNNSYLLWGMQLEIGAGATSYIPTTATTATRNSDVASVDTLSPWLLAGQGTLYTEVVANGGQSFHGSLGGANGSGPRIANWRGAAGNPGSQVIQDDFSVAFAYSAIAVSNGAILKQALAYSLNDFQAAAQGALSAVDTSGMPPTLSRLSIGSRGSGTDAMSGYVRKIQYLPYRLSASELQAITT